MRRPSWAAARFIGSRPAPVLAGRRASTERLPRAVGLLVTASVVVAIGYGIASPALPIFARSFDVSVTAASALVSAFAGFRLAFAPVSGRLVGRLGEVRMYRAGLIVVALSSAACALATTYGQLLIFRAIGGVGSTMFTVAAALLLIRLAPPSLRGRATGAWATGFLLGTMAGPLLGGALLNVSLRAPFLVYAGLLVVVAAMSGPIMRSCAGDRSGPRRPVAAAETFTRALQHPTFRAALTSNFVHGWTVYGIRPALVPLYVTEVLARPPGWSGLALTVTATGTALTLRVGGRWADASGRTKPARVGLAVTVVGMVWLGVAGGMAEFLVASLLAGAGSGLVYPSTNAAVADVVVGEGNGVGGGTALAGFQMVGDVGAVIGPLLAGLVAEAVGYGAAFAVSAAIVAGSLGCWLCTPETRPRGGTTPE